MSKIENAENVSLFALNANQPLAQAVADQVEFPFQSARLATLPTGKFP